MSHAEQFDVLDAQMNKIGTASRQQVHAQGLWHQTFHCWILQQAGGGQGKLLLQLRHPDKETFPNRFDISCAGHLTSGETVEDGVRELEEELGLSVPAQALTYCGVVAEETVISKDFVDREFSHVFLYMCTQPLQAYRFQLSEVSGLFLVDLEAFEQLLFEQRQAIPAEGIQYHEQEQRYVEIRREIGKADIALNSMAYYELLFRKIREYMGNRPSIQPE
ncbi:NUDIX hydrolase [Paenibacillus sp. y28]|uniref:NUDIX hydrolase n=1 Tax=Paenibacillus sp. y28 TaxID=3129110 RepID=UPI0030160C0A